MSRRLVAACLPLLGLLALTGCPQQAPGEGAFALDGAGAAWDAGALQDAAGVAKDIAAQEVVGGGNDAGGAGDSSAAADATVDAAGATQDASAQRGPCSGGPAQWFNQSLIAPQLEDGRDIAAVPGGGFIIAGSAGSSSYKTKARISRLSAYGTPLWHKTWGSGEKEDTAEAVVVLADGYAAAGANRSAASGSSDGWIVRTTPDGDPIWEKTYGGDKTDLFRGLAPASGGGLVAAGTNRSISGSLEDGWLLRTDKDGKVLWEFAYGGSHIDELYDVVADGDGFAAAGENWSDSSGGSDAWLLRVDAKGKQILSEVYPKGDKDWARALVRMPDGGFALTGKASDKGNPKLWVIRTDSLGSVLWESVEGGNQSEEGWGLAVWPDGTLAVVGDTNSGKTGVDLWQLRYDKFGNLLWSEVYGGPGNQWGRAIVALEGGQTMMVGRAWATSTQSDVYLVRAGPWGHGTCAAVGVCADKAPGDCDDGLPCTADRCDSIDGCTHEPLKDKAPCGAAMQCYSGKCVQG